MHHVMTYQVIAHKHLQAAMTGSIWSVDMIVEKLEYVNVCTCSNM